MNSGDVSVILTPRLNEPEIKNVKDKFLNEMRDLALKPSHYKTVNLINRIVDQHGVGPRIKLELLSGLSNTVKKRYGLEHVTLDNITPLYDNLVIIYLKVKSKVKSTDDLNKLVTSISYVVLYINQLNINGVDLNDTVVIQKVLTRSCTRKEIQACLTETNLTDKGKNLVNKILDNSQDEENVGQIDVMKGEHDRKIFLGLNKCSIILLIIAFFLLTASFITLWALFEFDIIPTKNKDDFA